MNRIDAHQDFWKVNSARDSWDGGMMEYLSVPSPSLLHGEGLSFDELALVEPLAIGAHGVRRAEVEPGEFVLVIGAGPIGLGTMEFARIAGAQVIALDVNDQLLNSLFTSSNNTRCVI